MLNLKTTTNILFIYSRKYSKEFKILNKLMNKGSKKRNGWRDFDTPPGASLLSGPFAFARGPQSNKRVAVLNKLFMKHITDLMASGKCSERVSGLGIEVTKVKVGSEYNLINVFWTCNGLVGETEVTASLSKVAGELREELTGLHVVGKVPHIQFVRDKSAASWAAVESLLSTADLGDDYVPKGVAALKSDFGNERKAPRLPSHSESETTSGDMPAMRENVLGLNRADILERLMVSMKGKPTIRHNDTTSGLAGQQYKPFDQEAFARFLKERKIERDRAVRHGEIGSRFDIERNSQDDFVDIDSLTDNDDFLEEEIDPIDNNNYR